MKKENLCAYCEKKAKLTREHIVPSWYVQMDKSPDDITFLEKAQKKFIKSDLVIRDVCEDCNSGPLSALDEYGRTLYVNHLATPVFLDSEGSIEFDFEQLSKWLLKISYNSARANDTDLEVLHQYKDLVISKSPTPERLFIYLATVAPTVQGANGDVSSATRYDDYSHEPTWFRVGVFRVPGFDSIDWAFRHISINSFCFYVCVPSLNSASIDSEAALLREAIARAGTFGAELPRGGSMIVPVPVTNSISYSLAHMAAFPFSYELVQSDALQAALDNEFGLVNYWIDRLDIDSGNTTNMLSFLADLVSSREVVMGLRDRVEFSVHGYDEDPRELYEIPEVVDFLRNVDQQWPYWVIFQHPDLSWIKMLFAILCGAKRSNEGQLDLDGDLMDAIIDRWFIGLNELSHTHAITLKINKDASEKFVRMLRLR